MFYRRKRIRNDKRNKTIKESHQQIQFSVVFKTKLNKNI